MKKEQLSIFMNIGILIIGDIYRRFYFFIIFIFFIIVVLGGGSCNRIIRVQNNYTCEAILYYDSITNKNVYIIVDEMPKFPIDNEIGLIKYIIERYNIKQENRQHSFNLQFVVDKQGVLHGIRVKNKRTSGYSKSEIEMIKIFETMPKWISGKCSGQNVDVLVSVPIMLNFKGGY